MGEDELKNQLKEAEEKNINLRFDSMDKNIDTLKTSVNREFTDIKTLLLKTIDNYTIISEELRGRVLKLEEKQRNCPITPVRLDLRRYSKDTAFVRLLFGNPWKVVVISTLWILLIVMLVIAFGPGLFFDALIKLRGF